MNQMERLLVLLFVRLLGKGAHGAEGSIHVCLVTNAWEKWRVWLWKRRDTFGTNARSHNGAVQCSASTCRKTGSWTAGGKSPNAKEQSWLSSLPLEVADAPRYQGDVPTNHSNMFSAGLRFCCWCWGGEGPQPWGSSGWWDRMNWKAVERCGKSRTIKGQSWTCRCHLKTDMTHIYPLEITPLNR